MARGFTKKEMEEIDDFLLREKGCTPSEIAENRMQEKTFEKKKEKGVMKGINPNEMTTIQVERKNNNPEIRFR
jgi:hypothetical protein